MNLHLKPFEFYTTSDPWSDVYTTMQSSQLPKRQISANMFIKGKH